jgi:iron(III) transport system permease protein
MTQAIAQRTTAAPPRVAAGARSRRRGFQRRIVVGVAALIAATLLLPLVLIVIDAHDAGWTEFRTVLFRERSLILLRHTVVLAALVAALAGVLGVATAWCTERCALPGRRVWTVLLVLPIAMPDFVVGYAWHTISPRMDPLFAATLVMTLGTYPLVYLPVAAALRRADPVMEDTAHSLGVGRVSTFLRVSLPLVRTAVLGGCVLVVLTVISEYGAFEILRYTTFTTEIFTEFQFEPSAAGALAIPLIGLGLIALSAEGFVGRRRGRPSLTARRPKARARWSGSWRSVSESRWERSSTGWRRASTPRCRRWRPWVRRPGRRCGTPQPERSSR